ncbi:MAG: translation elongation factor Ts [Candidatus Omnitrophica bacterium]|nr:translation elongation factor Ts [Candidatus Omnitrophota bacterium]MBU1047528.1 translation elongation factor Ts [Candidatus Omnitrophota bacterium]MBU1630608.1 translation elongation factor Ts [Candidatus Omnitrophota bacterium]MBU1767350.1 translation elongation factor Ts [Candidatus Omnitrophota bacterium]MBU1888891.1 translation elongation factor Ts [Candidatus Omnitrophota bacterium]
MSKKIDLILIKKLRAKTDAPIVDCKNSLEEANGDLTQAVEILRKKGITKGQEKKERVTSEGRIASYIHFGGKIGVLVEINCETDFVARTDEFKNLVKDITMHIAASNPKYIAQKDVPEEVIKKETDLYNSQSSDKPAAVIEKIAQGKLKKFYSEVCLLNQPFVKDPSKTIGGIIDEHIGKIKENIQVKRFIRYHLGEQ